MPAYADGRTDAGREGGGAALLGNGVVELAESGADGHPGRTGAHIDADGREKLKVDEDELAGGGGVG